MKLSHAASRLRTAIAELRRAIGVGSGVLLGHWWKEPMLWFGIIVGFIIVKVMLKAHQ